MILQINEMHTKNYIIESREAVINFAIKLNEVFDKTLWSPLFSKTKTKTKTKLVIKFIVNC